MTLGQGHDTPLGNGQQLCEILSRSTLQWGVMGRTRNFGMCALWPWPWRYDLRSRSWHILESWTTIVWNIIQIKLGTAELWPRHRFSVYVYCYLDLGDMTLGQGHDTLLGNGQQLCEILSRSNFATRSYCPDMDFWYVCTLTLTLEIWPWVKVMTHPLAMDNNCVKYYADRTSGYGVMARTRIEQTDGRTEIRTDRVIPIYPPYCGRYNYNLALLTSMHIHFSKISSLCWEITDCREDEQGGRHSTISGYLVSSFSKVSNKYWQIPANKDFITSEYLQNQYLNLHVHKKFLLEYTWIFSFIIFKGIQQILTRRCHQGFHYVCISTKRNSWERQWKQNDN